MRAVILALCIFLTINLTAQENQFDPEKKYHPDSLKHWMKRVMVEVSEKHPGFYRYTSKEKFDNLIDSTAQTIEDSLTVLNYYRKMKYLFAQIGCLHTGVALPKEYESYLDKTPTLIPIEVFIDSNNKVFVTKIYGANKDMQIGSEVISINDKPISEILCGLLKVIPSDGFNQTEKFLLLNHRFAFWYRTIIEVVDTFRLEIKVKEEVRTAALNGVEENVFPTLESSESGHKKTLEFTEMNQVGILTVHSFARTNIRASGQDFKTFIKNVFRQLEAKGIENLIIDLRYNTGGTDGNAALLASYFFDKPFRYWDNIQVTEATASEIRGTYKLFYSKPTKVDSTYRWRKTWVTNEFNYYQIQKPAKKNFKGNTFILTNGLCLSSCSDFVAILWNNKKAKVVGQETGGGFQGNTSGMMPTAEIPTGLRVTVPLQKYINAVDLSKNFGRGTIPDLEVTPTFDDWVNKKDTEMELVLELIN
jgi:hypothetical protein